MDEIITVELKEYRAVPGTLLKIPLSIRNITQQADSLELTFQGIPLSWITLPAPVVSLLAGEQKTVDILLNIPPVPEIQAGYHPLKITAASQTDSAIKGEIEVKLALAAFESHGRIGVMIKSIQFSTAPGGTLTIPLTVLNHGLDADTFRLGVEGIPASWASTTTPVSPLEPGESKEIALVVHPPYSPSSEAGRKKFRLVLTSQAAPDQTVSIDCVLTLTAYTKFNAVLEPGKVEAGQPVRVNVQNEGNTQRVFQLTCVSQSNQLIFDYLQPEAAKQPAKRTGIEATGQMNADASTGGQPGGPINSQPYPPAPITGGKTSDPTVLPIPPGGSAAFRFSVRPRQRPLVGGKISYPYQVSVAAKQTQSINLFGQVLSSGMIPLWVLPIALVLCCCLILSSGVIYLVYPGQTNSASQTSAAGTALAVNSTQAALASTAVSASVTQTIIANQTAAAAAGQEDSDGDGLTNDREMETKTDPANPDSDGDGLLDGEEVFQSGTNPLIPDSDGDGLSDGDEIRRRTNPLAVDSDGDHSGDGDEVRLGTNPLNPDSDGDGLVDGSETLTCPAPLNPDSDQDGIIDGKDMSPCDPNNPVLTATSAALQATATPVPPTQIPIPTPTFIPTPPPIVIPSVTPTQAALPTFNGMVLFESDRDGNLEIYTTDSAGHLRRMTDNPYADFQPVWQPGLQRLAFTTNRDGQNEIYLMNADGTNLINLTNNQADDQYPSFSEDGEWITFSSNRNGNYEIYILRVSNFEIQNLTNNPANDTQPDWVRSPTMDPSDEYVVFTSDRDGNLEIYRMKTNGTGVENLTVNPASDQMAKGSSDGSLVVFTTNRDGNQEIYYMRRDGKSLVNLTNNLANDYGATWSPADVWVAFTTERNGNREVYLTKSGTTELYNLTNHPYQDTVSDWR